MKRFLILAVVVCAVPVSVLQVGVSTGDSVASDLLLREVILDISYVHSVELTRVEERYRAGPTGITLELMRWQSTGAGLPDSYDTWEDGYYTAERQMDVGNQLSYWFLPLSEPSVRINDNLVLQGIEMPGLVSMRVRTLPVALHLLALLKS